MFALFAQGVEAVDVVVRLRVHPLAVEAMYEKWLAMRGAFVVTRELSAKIDSRLSFRPSEGSCSRKCRSCGRRSGAANARSNSPHWGALCPGCAKGLSVQEAKRKAIEAELREMTKEKERGEADFMSGSEMNAKLRRTRAPG